MRVYIEGGDQQAIYKPMNERTQKLTKNDIKNLSESTLKSY